jgi:Fe-S oxidoreductase/nitrate reductase gamma subunit
MVYAVYRRHNIWHLGKPDSRLKTSLLTRWKAFINFIFVDIIFHRKLVGVADNLGHRPMQATDLKPKEIFPGIMHFMLVAGFVFLLIGTAMDIVSFYIYSFIGGNIYFGHLMLTNVGGVMLLIGAAMAFVRRYGLRPERLENKREDLVDLLAIVIITLTGFVLQGLRIASLELPSHPEWSRWAPLGWLFGVAFSGISHDTLIVTHRIVWWTHTFIVFGFMAYFALNFNRLWHIVVSPFNVFWRNLGLPGAMTPIDLDKVESFGVAKIEDFSWKHLLDLDACTRCGRCADICPANLSGKPLNPMKIIQDLKGHLLERAPFLLSARAKVTVKSTQPEDVSAGIKPMIGGVIGPDAIWNCTTCFACQEVCPVAIEPMLKVSEIRRNLVLEKAAMPETAEGALRSIEDRGHPWRGTSLERTSWFEGLGIRTLAEDNKVDVLFWVGCTEALEERSLKVAQSTGRLLKNSGIKFGVLGAEESCCGDPARRLGNEYLYQMQAAKNIQVLNKYNVKKIVTGCPHCFNTLKNEYPQFGGNFEVVHHTDFILQLIKDGKLKISQGPHITVTYNDACYLGRYNNIFEKPRKLLKYVPGVSLVEMAQNRERSFCCGAGGGHMWLEEQKTGERINVMRTVQAIAIGAQIVATACPYCLQMFQDGIKTRGAGETLKAMDISEILVNSLGS